jgi:predicted Rossmann fold nucleotide-binding protein DprA/Smf involved in DNA uptake
MTIATLGNTEILKLSKTAFLCSRKVSAGAVLKCYDWAIEQREQGICVISGFHSQIEKDVLHYLLKGTQPIVVALARGLKDNIEPELIKPVEQGRILIISPFEKGVRRVTEQTASVRNKMMLEVADNVVIGFASANGLLKQLLLDVKKSIQYLT